MRDTGIGPGEAARRLGVSTRTVQRWLREGRLPGIRVGSRLRVDPSALPRGSSGGAGRPIRRLLVANRGELVSRIARTCRRLDIACLALVSDDQAGAWWTRSADEVVALHGTYLDSDAVLRAARAGRADAIHPGYGFLAENAAFAEAVLAAGLAWVGPPPEAMRALGDKAAARRAAAEAGIPVLAGYDGERQHDASLRRAAADIGYPVLIKPSGGGGGKGMHVVAAEADLGATLERARREARSAFGDDRLILERYLGTPRHIEVQVLGDTHGGYVHLGERECSLQRRHQKVVEEAPSPAVDDSLRRRLGEAALELARRAGYVGAGTAEFLVGDTGDWYFLELNARLQVEHPVTEMVTGRDLVADQLRIASGEPLGFGQADVALGGHAIEARLYAEDPAAGFVPATGTILGLEWPAGDGIRVDAGVGIGDTVGPRYDPLLAKIVARGDTRDDALRVLVDALAATSVVGVTTNRGFLRWLLERPEVVEGRMDTQFVDAHWQPDAEDAAALPEAAWRAAARALVGQASGDARTVPVGFRLNAGPRIRVDLDGVPRSVELAADYARGASSEAASGAPRWAAGGDGTVVIDVDGRSVRARLAAPPTVASAMRHGSHGAASAVVTAPMPGQIVQVLVGEGQAVEPGQVLVVLEAMKMENAVPAPAAASVTRVLVEAGQQVGRGDPLVELA